MSLTSISFIVPVYNVLRYLDECVTSLVAASREGDEIILVDDGSTDASGARCDAWQQRQPSLISVIHQANGGLSLARNRGLASARNPYIYFLDSDDILCSEHFDLIRAELANHSPDMLTCDALIWVDGTPRGEAKRITHSLPTGLSLDKFNALRATFEDDFFATASRVYRKDLLLKLMPAPFPPGQCYEDNDTVPRLVLRSARFVYVPKPIYVYRTRPGSITQTHNFKKCVDQAKSLHRVICELRQANVSDTVLQAANTVAFKHIVMATRNLSRAPSASLRDLMNLVDCGMKGLSVNAAELVRLLKLAPHNRKTLLHARKIIYAPRLYVLERWLNGAWQKIRTKQKSSA